MEHKKEANTVPAVVAVEGKKGQKSREKRDKNNESKPKLVTTERNMDQTQMTTEQQTATAAFKQSEQDKAELALLRKEKADKAAAEQAAAAAQAAQSAQSATVATLQTSITNLDAKVNVIGGLVSAGVEKINSTITSLDTEYKKRSTKVLYYKAGGLTVGAGIGFLLTAELLPDPTTAQQLMGTSVGALVGTALGNAVGQAMTEGSTKKDEKK